jgi:hypothetical protein
VITKSSTPFDRAAVARLGGDVEEELGAVRAALADFGIEGRDRGGG